MKYAILFTLGLLLFMWGDILGARVMNRNSVSQHVQFSSRSDRRPNVWPFELFLTPAHKL
jgi:hypothetical protein